MESPNKMKHTPITPNLVHGKPDYFRRLPRVLRSARLTANMHRERVAREKKRREDEAKRRATVGAVTMAAAMIVAPLLVDNAI